MLELSNRLETIDHKVHLAKQKIDSEEKASERTKEAVQAFCAKSEEALRELNKAKRADAKKLLSDVFELEELGDQAKEAAKDDQDQDSLSMEGFQAVIDAHNSVNYLKAELSGTANPG